MAVTVRGYREEDVADMTRIWNQVVEDGVAFPQEYPLREDEARDFFGSFPYCGVAELDGKIVGMYEIRPNNVGRCGHIGNASYAVDRNFKNLHIGRAMVSDSLVKAKELGFRIMQFNAVVKENSNARHLYESLGFVPIGTVPGGFRAEDGYHDIVLYYREL